LGGKAVGFGLGGGAPTNKRGKTDKDANSLRPYLVSARVLEASREHHGRLSAFEKEVLGADLTDHFIVPTRLIYSEQAAAAGALKSLA
jgi:hypothetical protein